MIRENYKNKNIQENDCIQKKKREKKKRGNQNQSAGGGPDYILYAGCTKFH